MVRRLLAIAVLAACHHGGPDSADAPTTADGPTSDAPTADAPTVDAPTADAGPDAATMPDAATGIAIHVTGVGAAELVNVETGAVAHCIDDCTLAALPGELIHATAYAATSFVGWSGPCTGTDPNCAFTFTAPTSITAEFTASATTFLRPGGLEAQAAVVTPAGTLALAIGGTLELIDIDGTVIWSTSAGGGALAGIAVDGAGNLYVLGNALTKISPDGAELWSVPGSPSFADIDELRDMVAVLTDGRILVGNAIYDSDGNMVTTIPLTGVLGVAADRTGGFYIATEAAAGPDATDAHHYDAAGTELGPTITVPGYNVMLAVDTLGRLWGASSGHSHFWLTVDGTVVYDDHGSWPADIPCGIAADWSGNAVPIHDTLAYNIYGHSGWPVATNQDGDIGGIIPQAIAAGPGSAYAGTLITPHGGYWELISIDLHP